MKFVKLILAITIAVMCSGTHASAQETSGAAKTNSNAALNHSNSYRLNYTVTEKDGTKRLGTQHFSMMVVSGKKTQIKQVSKIPIATGAYNPGDAQGQPQNQSMTQFQYLDVGWSIEASLDESADGVRLNTKLEQSSIAEEKSGVGVQDPIVRATSFEGSSILVAGKPLLLGSMDIPNTTRHLDIEVMLEQVVQ